MVRKPSRNGLNIIDDQNIPVLIREAIPKHQVSLKRKS